MLQIDERRSTEIVEFREDSIPNSHTNRAAAPKGEDRLGASACEAHPPSTLNKSAPVFTGKTPAQTTPSNATPGRAAPGALRTSSTSSKDKMTVTLFWTHANCHRNSRRRCYAPGRKPRYARRHTPARGPQEMCVAHLAGSRRSARGEIQVTVNSSSNRVNDHPDRSS
jgi:hypothetical protein